MDNGKPNLLEIVEDAFERTGAFAGKVATIGNKITCFASNRISAGKAILGLSKEPPKPASVKKTDGGKTDVLKTDDAPALRNLTEVEKTQSKLESQIKKLKTENRSLALELDKVRNELSEALSRESSVRARATALESELDEARCEIEEMQSKPGMTTAVVDDRDKHTAELESELAAVRHDLDQMREKTEKTQSKAKEVQARRKSQINSLQSENRVLKSELEQLRFENNRMTVLEEESKERISRLEAELAAAGREPVEMQNQAGKDLSGITLQFKDLQLEKESLISDLEKARDKINEMTFQKEQVSKRTAQLESELADTQNQAEHIQAEFKKRLQDLRAENEVLVFKLADARKETDDERIRACTLETQIATLESNVTAFKPEPEKISEEELDVDVVPSQAVSESANKDQSSMPADVNLPRTEHKRKFVIIPTVEEIKPSIETTARDDEQINESVENVEVPGQEPEPESEAEIDTEKTEPKPISEVESKEPVEVTAEDIEGADFENETEKIIFTKALSDFVSADTAARVDAARSLAGINHKLSVKAVIAHMENERSALVRQECIKALATLEMAEGLKAVESALADETAFVRLAAVWGVYRLAGGESTPKLLNMLSDDDENVRRRAVTCIGWLGEELRKINDSRLHQVTPALIECLNDSSESIRKAALDALQAVTGKKLAKDGISHQGLIKQWRNWWRTQLLG
jgi:DNA repair exonuclease SbcCD ATPase subunit